MNVLNISNLYFKNLHHIPKKHNLSPITHKVNTRHAARPATNFSLKFPKKKTGCRKIYDFIGTQIHNLFPKEVTNMSLQIFKKYITSL